MTRKFVWTIFGLLMVFSAAAAPNVRAAETFTGTVVSYGTGFSTRTRTGTFTLIIDRYTTDEEAQRFLSVLQEGGQDALLKTIRDQELGRFSVGPRVGIDLNFIQQEMVDGKRRIFIVFERWTQFAELRYGMRSLDYPFGVIELFIDPATGKGEGTYIAAARLRWTRDNKTNQYAVEVENFATWPAKLMGVQRRGGPRV